MSFFFVCFIEGVYLVHCVQTLECLIKCLKGKETKTCSNDLLFQFLKQLLMYFSKFGVGEETHMLSKEETTSPCIICLFGFESLAFRLPIQMSRIYKLRGFGVRE